MANPQPVASVSKGQGQLFGLQYFRGLGVMLVISHHVVGYTTVFMPLDWPEGMRELAIRHLHVFFVVSGFIMMYIHANDKIGWTSFRLYMLKRHIRIFPMVIGIVTAGALGLIAAYHLGLADEMMSWKQYISSAFIYPMLEKPRPVVIWTLRNELTFYVIFAMYFISRRLFLVTMVGWVVASFLLGARGAVGEWADNGALDELSENIFFETLFWDFNYLFVLGIAIYYIMRWMEPHVKLSGRTVTAGFIIIYALFCFAAFRKDIFSPELVSTNYILGALSALLVYFSAGAHIGKWFHSTLLYLGDASYAMYLVHMVVLGFLAPIIGSYFPTGWTLYFTLLTIASIAGLVAYEWFEKPALKYLRRFAK